MSLYSQQESSNVSSSSTETVPLKEFIFESSKLGYKCPQPGSRLLQYGQSVYVLFLMALYPVCVVSTGVQLQHVFFIIVKLIRLDYDAI